MAHTLAVKGLILKPMGLDGPRQFRGLDGQTIPIKKTLLAVLTTNLLHAIHGFGLFPGEILVEAPSLELLLVLAFAALMSDWLVG